MKQECRNLDGRALAAACVRIAEEAKAEDLVVLDVRGLASFTDYFLIMSGRSTRHVQGLAGAIEEALSAKRANARSVRPTQGVSRTVWVSWCRRQCSSRRSR